MYCKVTNLKCPFNPYNQLETQDNITCRCSWCASDAGLPRPKHDDHFPVEIQPVDCEYASCKFAPGQLALGHRTDELYSNVPSNSDPLFVLLLRVRLGSWHVKESNPSPLVGFEARSQTVEVDVITKKVAGVA